MEFKYEKIESGDRNFIAMEFIENGITYGIGVEENAPIIEVIRMLERKIKQQKSKEV